MNKKKILRLVINSIVMSIVSLFIICIINKCNSNYFINYTIINMIYNEGMEEIISNSKYDSITIESPNKSDREKILHNGLKYVNNTDLMKLKLENCWEKVEFKENVFKVSIPPYIIYLKITVDKEHTDDITYYKYKQCINYIVLIIYVVILFIVYCFIFYIIKYIDIRIRKILEDD